MVPGAGQAWSGPLGGPGPGGPGSLSRGPSAATDSDSGTEQPPRPTDSDSDRIVTGIGTASPPALSLRVIWLARAVALAAPAGHSSESVTVTQS